VQLAIPHSDILRYYKIQIARCEIFEDQIIISAKIPLLQKNASFEIHEPIPIPIKYENEICEIKLEKSIVVNDITNKKLYTLTGYALLQCNEKLWSIANAVNEKNALCPRVLF